MSPVELQTSVGPKDSAVHWGVLRTEGLLFGLTVVNALVFAVLVYPRLTEGLNLSLGGPVVDIAASLLDGGGFTSGSPTSQGGALRRGPLYPLFLAAVWSVTPFRSQLGLVVSQALLIGATSVALLRLASLLCSLRVARIAALLFAFYPLTFWYVPRTTHESLLTLLMVAFVYWSVRAVQEERPRSALFAGLFLGLASLTQPTTLFLPLVLPVAYRLSGSSFRTGIRLSLITGVVMIGLILPWTARNARISNHFVFLNTGGGAQFLMGSYMAEALPWFGTAPGYVGEERVREMYSGKLEELRTEQPTATDPELEAEVDQHFSRLAKAHVLEAPKNLVEKILKGVFFFWYLGESAMKSIGLAAMRLPVLLLALVGFSSVVRTRRRSLFLIPVVAYFVLSYATITAYGRYAVPVMPFVFIFAAGGVVNVWDHLRPQRKSVSRT